MFLASLNDDELQTIVIALKYWRHHRRDEATRKGDRMLSPQDVDVLLAKLRMGTLSARPPDASLTDLFSC